MTGTRESLYRAICTSPDEDTPRLAFADLLDEEGEAARAGFIRTQIALARSPAHDPYSVATRLTQPDALTGHGMVHTLPRLPDGYSWSTFEFRRGFPWKVGVVSAGAFDPDGAVFAAAPIRALDFGACDRPCLDSLADWPHLSRIHRLDFTNADLGRTRTLPLILTTYATALTELGFSYNGITEDGLEALASSTLFARLTALDLDSIGSPAALLVDALGAARSPGMLSRLSLAANRLDGIDVAHLLALPIVRNLRHLGLADNPQIGLDGAKALARGAVRLLESLDLSQTHPGLAGMTVLGESGMLAGLRRLDLSANRLGPTAAKRLAASALRRLRVLNLSANPIGDSGAVALADSPALAGLLDLDLADTRLSDTGALALAKSPHLGGLLRLNLTMSGSNVRPFGPAARRALILRFGGRVIL